MLLIKMAKMRRAEHFGKARELDLLDLGSNCSLPFTIYGALSMLFVLVVQYAFIA